MTLNWLWLWVSECERLSISMCCWPVIDWQPVHTVSHFSPNNSWDWLQPPATFYRTSSVDNKWMKRIEKCLYISLLKQCSCTVCWTVFSRTIFYWRSSFHEHCLLCGLSGVAQRLSVICCYEHYKQYSSLLSGIAVAPEISEILISQSSNLKPSTAINQ